MHNCVSINVVVGGATAPVNTTYKGEEVKGNG